MANVLPAGRGLGCSASSGAGHTVGLQQTLLALCRYEGHLTNLSVVCSGQGGHHPHFAGGKLSQRDEGTCPEHPEGDALGPGPHVGAQPSLCDVVLGSRLTWTLSLSTQDLPLFTHATVSFQDESHFLKNIKTARCRAALTFLKVSAAEDRLGA